MLARLNMLHRYMGYMSQAAADIRTLKPIEALL